MKPCEASPTCLHETCKYCDRPVRAGGSPIKDHPNTIVGVLKTRTCLTCQRTGGAPRRLQRAPDNCVRCDHPMRRQSVPKESAPGTRPYQGRGLCTTCYMRDRRAAGAAERAKQREAKQQALERLQAQKALEIALEEQAAEARREREWLDRLKQYEPGTYRYIMGRREHKHKKRVLAARHQRLDRKSRV